MKIYSAFIAAFCSFINLSVAADIYADRSTIRIKEDGSEFSHYDTRNTAMSADGRFVAESMSGEVAETGSIAITDMQLRKTHYLRNNKGELIFQSQVFLSMSPSGRYLALRPQGEGSSPDDFGPEGQYLYVYDTASGRMNAVEKSYDGSALLNCSPASAIIGSSLSNWGKDSFAGDKQLFFYSTCSNLVINDTNGVADIFVYDIDNKTIELLTRNPLTGEPFAGQSVNPLVSADGHIIVFASRARDIIDFTCSPSSNAADIYHIYVFNRNTGEYRHLNYCHGGDSDIKTLAYDVSDDGNKVYFFGKTFNNHPALVALDVKTNAINRTELPYSFAGSLATNQDGSIILYRSQGYYDEGTYHAEFNGNPVTAYHLYHVNSGVHTLISSDIYSGDVWYAAFTQPHATLSSSAHVVTFGTSDISAGSQTLVDTAMTYGETSAYFYLHQPFAKNTYWITVRGTFNDWHSYAGGMTLVADHEWQAEVIFTASGSFKFDLSGDWHWNFGDNNADGIAGYNEANIPQLQGAGRYQITFNDQTHQYNVKKILAVKFTCNNGYTVPGQSVYVVGNTAELGNWHPADAVKLSPISYPSWSGTLVLPVAGTIEWKCIKRNEVNPLLIFWQPGSNNQFTLFNIGNVSAYF